MTISPWFAPALRARATRLACAAGLLLAVVACGGDPADRPPGADVPDAAAAPGAAAPGAAAPGAAAPGAVAPGAAAPGAAAPGANSASGSGLASGDCRMSGPWQRCSAVESVERAGYRLELLRDSVAQPGLAVRGAAYRLGSAELQLFVFADSAAAVRAAATVDADDAEPAETRGILRPPAVIRSNNLVALLFDNNDRLRERVQLALAAGLPPG